MGAAGPERRKHRKTLTPAKGKRRGWPEQGSNRLLAAAARDETEAVTRNGEFFRPAAVFSMRLSLMPHSPGDMSQLREVNSVVIVSASAGRGGAGGSGRAGEARKRSRDSDSEARGTLPW